MQAQIRTYTVNKGELDTFIKHFKEETNPLYDKVGWPIVGIVEWLGMIVSAGHRRHVADALAAAPALRRPAPSPGSRPHSQSGAASLRGPLRRPANPGRR